MNELTKNEGFSFTPKSLEEAMRYAKLIAESDLVPKDYKGKPGNVLVAIQMGQEVGLKPMKSLQNISVINGRPSIWGDAIPAILMAHPDFEDMHESITNGKAECTIKRRNRKEQTRSFSIEDAKKSGLWGKQGPWSQYPERMLQMRARGFAARDIFADALKGIHSAEESYDLSKTQYKSINEFREINVIEEINNLDFSEYKNKIESSSNEEELKEAFKIAYKAYTGNKEKQNELVDIKDKRKIEMKEESIPEDEREKIEEDIKEWKKEYSIL